MPELRSAVLPASRACTAPHSGCSTIGGVFPGVRLSFVDDLAEISAVLQDQVERTARERLAASDAARSARPRLAVDPAGIEIILQQPHRAEFGIAAEDRANGFRLAVDDDELAVLYPIPERRHAAHPHPFSL